MHHSIAEKIFSMLPLAYAFVSTCFWLLMLYTGKMNFVIQRIASVMPSTLVILYSFSALLFWLPVLRRKTYWSFLHSLLLFLLPFCNILVKMYRHKIIPHDYIISLLRIYTAGFIIYVVAITFLLLSKWVAGKFLFKPHKA